MIFTTKVATRPKRSNQQTNKQDSYSQLLFHVGVIGVGSLTHSMPCTIKLLKNVESANSWK